MILGREVSGVVMECGLDVKYFRERDEVLAVCVSDKALIHAEDPWWCDHVLQAEPLAGCQ